MFYAYGWFDIYIRFTYGSTHSVYGYVVITKKTKPKIYFPRDYFYAEVILLWFERASFEGCFCTTS